MAIPPTTKDVHLFVVTNFVLFVGFLAIIVMIKLFKLTKDTWLKIGQKTSWLVEAMGLEGQIQSYIKKVQSKKTGQEFYTLVLYGNTRPISKFLGKPKKGFDDALFFNYFQETWSRIIPDAFIE